MSTEEQVARNSGSVPHAYGNALAWKWSRDLPTPLRRGFLTLLYALRAMANANGELKFQSDHKPIRIQDIAKAAGASEKDARRYLDAAIRAGVVGVKGERRRGKPTLYSLAVSPRPDWQAAVDHLKATARKPGKGPAPWSMDTESSGDRDPNQFGPPRPELTDGTAEEVRAPATRMSSGDRDPNGSGDRDPNNPGSTHEISQDGAEVGFQPQVVGASGTTELDSHEPPHPAKPDTEPRPGTWAYCPTCHRRHIPRRPGGQCTRCANATERHAS